MPVNKNERYVPHGNQIVDVTTGEVLILEEIGDAINSKIQEQFTESVEDIVEVDGNLKFRLVRSRSGEEHQVINVKENYEFTKMFKVDVRGMLETIKLSVYAKAFMYEAMAYLHFPTNTIIYKGTTPSIEILCEMMDIKKTKMYDVLKELDEKEVIKRQKRNGSLVIYLNPFLHSCGLVDKNTYDLFKDSQYNPLNQ